MCLQEWAHTHTHLSSMYCTREGVIGIKDINLLPTISIDVTRCHSDGVALAISQGIKRGAAVVNSYVDEPPPLLVVLQHQVWAIEAVNGEQNQAVTSLLYKTVRRVFEA